MEIINELTFLGKIYHTGFGFQKEKNTNMVINYGCNNEDNEDADDELIQYDELVNRANKVVQYKKIILKFESDYEWYKMPNDWYNNPSKWWKDDRFQNDLLPYLNSREYIRVVDRFIEIEINSEKKGSPITLDDILFATRGLALDDTRTVCNFDDKYKIVSSNCDTLVLEVGLDNFST